MSDNINVEGLSNLKLARKRSGLSQKELSLLLGVPKRTIENYESGVRVPPDYVMDLLIEQINKMANKNDKFYDKTHGVYSLLEIHNMSNLYFSKLDLNQVILIDDYALGMAKVNSPINFLLIGKNYINEQKIKDDLEKIFHKNINIEWKNNSVNKLEINTQIERRGLIIYSK